jgi:hypothetical protein
MRRIAYLAILIAAVAILTLIWSGRRDSHAKLDPSAILVQVQQLNQLATVKYTVQKVVSLTDQKHPIGSESILLVMQATVEAGVDLTNLRADDVLIGGDGAVTLRTPAPKLLNVFVNEKETKVWDRQKTWWTPWVPYSLDLEQRARISGLESARQAALDMGILKQAEQSAQASIRGLLGLAGIKSVRFVPSKVT